MSLRCLCSFVFNFRMCDHHICFNLQRHLIYAAPPFPPQVPVPPVIPVTSICQVSWSRLYTCHCISSSLILIIFLFFPISKIQASIEASHHLTHNALLSWHRRKTLELHVMCSNAEHPALMSFYSFLVVALGYIIHYFPFAILTTDAACVRITFFFHLRNAQLEFSINFCLHHLRACFNALGDSSNKTRILHLLRHTFFSLINLISDERFPGFLFTLTRCRRIPSIRRYGESPSDSHHGAG